MAVGVGLAGVTLSMVIGMGASALFPSLETIEALDGPLMLGAVAGIAVGAARFMSIVCVVGVPETVICESLFLVTLTPSVVPMEAYSVGK